MERNEMAAAELSLDAVCACSENVVARTIDDEVIIIPLVAGIGDEEDELYTLNETGQAIWQELDGIRTLRDVAASLAQRYDGRLRELEDDVLAFAAELTRRGILVAK